jgi:S-adenosylmethionine:tRNA ribosyltransferase-isomerase
VDVVSELDEKTRIVEFAPDFAIHDFLIREGHVPLPPYIQRPDTLEDRERYQTVFAARSGAVAAPTAGLHFTQEILDRFRRGGVDFSTITLHVGAGTFVPIVASDPRDHVMEREYYRIGPEAAEEIGSTRAAAGRVVAVGTTVVRTLETAEVHVPGSDRWHVRPGDGWTEKYIYPPYEFHVVDAMVTNFHCRVRRCSSWCVLLEDSSWCVVPTAKRSTRAIGSTPMATPC